MDGLWGWKSVECSVGYYCYPVCCLFSSLHVLGGFFDRDELDRRFHAFRAPKSVDLRILCRSEMSIDAKKLCNARSGELLERWVRGGGNIRCSICWMYYYAIHKVVCLDNRSRPAARPTLSHFLNLNICSRLSLCNSETSIHGFFKLENCERVGRGLSVWIQHDGGSSVDAAVFTLSIKSGTKNAVTY